VEHVKPGSAEVIKQGMERKFIYLINPISGTKNKEQILAAIRERTTKQGIPFEILPTNPTGDYNYLKEKIIADSITDIIICGGDGTVNQVSKALLGVDIAIGIIPLGSGNGLALAAKIDKNTHKALDIIFTGTASYIDAFTINDAFSCMLTGIGFDGLVAHNFAKQSKRGLATYIKETFRLFFGATPYQFEIIHAEGALKTAAYFICIANANQFGNNVTIAPKAVLNDGLLDIVVVKKMSKLMMLWSVMNQVRKGQLHEYRDNILHKKNILYFTSKQLLIRNFSLAPMHIDGEPVETAKELNITIIPNAFKLIRPS
jgi:diacylglycerol kinase (ATP)